MGEMERHEQSRGRMVLMNTEALNQGAIDFFASWPSTLRLTGRGSFGDGRLDEAVTTRLPAVNHIMLLGLGIQKKEEIMAQQFHLLYSIFGEHRFGLVALDAHDQTALVPSGQTGTLSFHGIFVGSAFFPLFKVDMPLPVSDATLQQIVNPINGWQGVGSPVFNP
jgi:hypothetical protein